MALVQKHRVLEQHDDASFWIVTILWTSNVSGFENNSRA